MGIYITNGVLHSPPPSINTILRVSFIVIVIKCMPTSFSYQHIFFLFSLVTSNHTQFSTNTTHAKPFQKVVSPFSYFICLQVYLSSNNACHSAPPTMIVIVTQIYMYFLDEMFNLQPKHTHTHTHKNTHTCVCVCVQIVWKARIIIFSHSTKHAAHKCVVLKFTRKRSVVI